MKTSALVIPALLFAAGCSTMATLTEPTGTPRKEIIQAVTLSHELITFNAGTPQVITAKKPLVGLEAGDEVVGIDYRVARGMLYALTRAGRLYVVDPATGGMRQVGNDKFAVALDGNEFGFDFNPTVDRIRIVSDNQQNMRAHPDTGAVVDSNADYPGVQTDYPLAYAPGDKNQHLTPRIMGAGYTYNKTNDKLTTNYAIDGRNDLLVTQGTKEGETPVVSPNTGQLFTVGQLGVGESSRVSFDISDVNNAAYAAFVRLGSKESRLYSIDLKSGAATFLGTIAGGQAIRGMAIVP
ncbi:DUF4394 domain-containing protein [Usitatibacter palustris]|uniref:DUF4394 domain-containing protein n=1 Tax=Usitatibacter palustris TaxID=2732487 RepID=A0A6M4H6R7_9PROT|nr:DUF4394 domain-containing protein [Usitatibacter palustris]QJR15321.1 hypothetical protein DSM104440_02140 [Usitatibacter palustris]